MTIDANTPRSNSVIVGDFNVVRVVEVRRECRDALDLERRSHSQPWDSL